MIKFNKIVIRFRPRGHIFYPIYEIVVIKKRKRLYGDFIEKLGYFNPHYSERFLTIDFSRLVYWINKGAKINYSVKRYLVKFVV